MLLQRFRSRGGVVLLRMADSRFKSETPFRGARSCFMNMMFHTSVVEGPYAVRRRPSAFDWAAPKTSDVRVEEEGEKRKERG